MICAGLRFDDGSLDWENLYAFIFASHPNTAVFHAVEKGWTTSDHLLAHVIDGLRINNWQRTEGATKNPPRNVPEPVPRPGDENPAGVVDVGGVPATVTTVGDFLQMRAEREKRWRNNQKRRR